MKLVGIAGSYTISKKEWEKAVKHLSSKGGWVRKREKEG
jgi:hypothetical protein